MALVLILLNYEHTSSCFPTLLHNGRLAPRTGHALLWWPASECAESCPCLSHRPLIPLMTCLWMCWIMSMTSWCNGGTTREVTACIAMTQQISGLPARTSMLLWSSLVSLRWVSYGFCIYTLDLEFTHLTPKDRLRGSREHFCPAEEPL